MLIGLLPKLQGLFRLISLLIGLTGCHSDSIQVPLPTPGITDDEAILATSIANQANPLSTIGVQRISLLLALQGELADINEAIRAGFIAANDASPHPLSIKVLDTSQMANIKAAYAKAIQQRAEFVVGPLLKSQVRALAAQTRLPIPILALNYLGPDTPAPTQLYQFGLSPLDEASQVAALASQAGHRSGLILVPQGPWGQGVAQAFSEKWQALGGTIVDQLAFSSAPQRLNQQLRHLLRFRPPHERRQDFDLIFLAATPEQGRQIKPLLKFYYAGDIPIYSTALIYSGTPQPHLDADLDQIIFCDVPWNLGVQDAHTGLDPKLAARAVNQFKANSKYYALGVDAFRIVTQWLPLSSFGQQSVPGATGVLSLDLQRRIVRELPCAKFQAGVPVLLDVY